MQWSQTADDRSANNYLSKNNFKRGKRKLFDQKPLKSANDRKLMFCGAKKINEYFFFEEESSNCLTSLGISKAGSD